MEISFLRMPSSSRVLILSAIFSFGSALPWSGPNPTASYKPADRNPRPTSVPDLVPELIRRDNPNASICGWIGGNGNQPAACPSNQQCVYDTTHGMVGCCPLSGSCTVGVYTSCVHSALTVLNPSILTCTGESVCYENSYPGGYFQYGCGASTDSRSVATTFSGQNSDFQLPVVYTQLTLASTLSVNPTTSSAATSISQSSSTSVASSPTAGTTRKATPSNTSTGPSVAAQAAGTTAPSASASGTAQNSQSQAGIIAGSVIGGLVVIIAALAIGFLFMRRRQKKKSEEREKTIITKEKALSVSSYASSQISGRAGFHPFCPDDIVSPANEMPSYGIMVPTQDTSLPRHDNVSSAQDGVSPELHSVSPPTETFSPTHDIVSPMTPARQSNMASLQSALLSESPYDIARQSVPRKSLPQYAPPRQAAAQQPTPWQMNQQQEIRQRDAPRQEAQRSVEQEAPNFRRVQLYDGPGIDELADLPPPWVRAPTPPVRSPKRISDPRPKKQAPQIPPTGAHTPLEIYLNSSSLPLHPTTSVSSRASDLSRYSRNTDGRSIHSDDISIGWREEEIPPVPKVPKFPIARKPVGTGWYRDMGSSIEKKKSGDHVAFHLVGDARPYIGRSLTPPPREPERRVSEPPPALLPSDMLGLYAEICVNSYDGQGFEEMESASDRVAPLKLGASSRPKDVKKREDTQVPILGVPAAPPPGGRGSRLYDV